MNTSKSNTNNIDLTSIFEKYQLQTRLQGKRGTCSVFTVAGALEFALAVKQGTGKRLSVEYLNWASNQAVNKNHDGAYFSDLWEGFLMYGVCSETEMPYQEQFDPALKPDDSIQGTAKDQIKNNLRINWIKEWDVQTGLTDHQLEAIKETLRQQWPVCGGFRWPKKLVWQDNVMQIPLPEDVEDGHSVLLVGYCDDSGQPGGGVFLFRNTNSARVERMPYEYAKKYMNDAVWFDFSC